MPSTHGRADSARCQEELIHPGVTKSWSAERQQEPSWPASFDAALVVGSSAPSADQLRHSSPSEAGRPSAMRMLSCKSAHYLLYLSSRTRVSSRQPWCAKTSGWCVSEARALICCINAILLL